MPSGVAFKFSAKPAGLFVYHNTILGEQTAGDPASNMHYRNNLFLGRDTPRPRRHELGQRHALYHAIHLNFRLKRGSKAVDAGVRIRTVNDDFAGSTPDLGALEVGKPEPVYGPRWLESQPFYR